MLRITETTTIPEEEIWFVASRSSGPGGQNVNKVSTRVTLLFDVVHSPSLTPEQVDRIRSHLSTRISKEGILRVTAQRERSQAANRERARERFVELMRDALAAHPERRPTRTPRRANEERLAGKQQRGRLKRERAAPGDDYE